MPASTTTFVIVGAGLAGAKAAETLREEGFDGRIVLAGAEAERPYSRPPLSKGFLAGTTARERVFLQPEAFYAENEIELRTAATVERIEPERSEIVLGDGERVGFDRLLLATGSAPRRLTVPGAELDGVLYLRDLEDAEAIRARIEAGRRVVLIGAGWIGAEIGAVLRAQGLHVTIVDQTSVPLERVLGTEVGAVFGDLHSANGVELRLGSGVEAFEGNGSVERVRTSDGQVLDADFVVVGIGVTPRASLAESAGLRVDNGILVDEHLQTSVPGIYAAGDVTNAFHPFYGRHLRVEHWSNARHQGPTAARNMLGRSETYDRIPSFFSEQHDVGMRYWGHPLRWDEVVFRGDPASRQFLAFWLADCRAVAAIDVDVAEAGETVERLIRESKELDRTRLADPQIPLEEVVAEPIARRPKPAGKPLVATKNFVAEGLNFTRRFVGDRFAKNDPTPVDALADGEARILGIDGSKVAVYKDEQGGVHAVSPVCTHMRCLVDWNGADKTWDCPCHGSRFDIDGRVLEGPAKRDLGRREVA